MPCRSLKPVVLCGALCVVSCAPCRSASADATAAGAAEPSTAAAVYGEGVRPTDWLAPDQEREGFHLPPGFEVRLFASEPLISKPLNMALDDRGRLWVTHTVQYPYPAAEGAAAGDAVSVLVDRDGDGTADEATVFADQLNIPIGVLPYGDGCLCFSIPNLWYLRDTDGDGRCDSRQHVLGPFDTSRDTHGMVNALRDGGDGWIYACHGFNNQSQVAGQDGHIVTMHSGNTFRFRPDGSRIEQVTFGQVNPFGMTTDEWGYRYTADCHSKPITQLVRGACYPSFGRPHDGLGFLPPTVEHLHGSTAIGGIVYVPPTSSIVPLRGQLLSGNVMTSRLNRNRLRFEGATARGEEMPDFMTSDDPWFRPVDLQLAADGYLYVADFYNKIIGHYEIPLDHPQRDRHSGRIWQIRYVGPDADSSSPAAVAPPADSSDPCDSALRRPVAGDGTAGELAALLADECPQRRVAGLRLAAAEIDRAPLEPRLLEVVRSMLQDDSAHVVRGAAELVGLQGSEQDIERLLARLGQVSPRDGVLRQTIRIAVRNLLDGTAAESSVWASIPPAELASILLGVHRPQASPMLLRYLAAHPDSAERDLLISHAARYATADELDDCVAVARRISGGDTARQFELLSVLCQSQQARPHAVPEPLRQWALGLVAAELSSLQGAGRVIGWTSDDGGTWPSEMRRLAGGGESLLVSSLGRGEQYTGRWVSDHFAAPDEIVFALAGHNGFPDQPDHGKNRIRVVLCDTGQVVEEAIPPRSDTAQPIRWDTRALGGRQVRIECIDGDAAGAFAWIACGEFQPAWLHDSRSLAALATALDWVQRLGLQEHAGDLQRMLTEDDLSRRLRIEVARTLAALHGNHVAVITLQFLRATDAPQSLVEPAIEALLSDDQAALREATGLLCKRLSATQQRQFAIAWATQGADIQMLLDMAQWGWISREVLLDPTAEQTISPRLDAAQRLQVAELTANLDISGQQVELLQHLQRWVTAHRGDRENGNRLYTKHCGACHQLRGEGAVVGPQLDGAASRSVERLLEDVITPDRNIDQAFRTTSFLLDEGRVVVGLVVAETADGITVVESSGKSVTIAPETVESRREAGRSLMPGNLGEVLSAAELTDLIHFVRGG